MPKTAMITTPVEPGLEKDVSAIFQKLGISTADAITLFFKMVKRNNGLPFESTTGPDEENDTVSPENKPGNSWLGCLEDCTEIHGDIVSPVMDESAWEVLAE